MSASRPLLMAIGVAAVLVLIPLTAAAQPSAGQTTGGAPTERRTVDKPRPEKPGAPVNANVGKDRPAPPDSDLRTVRPAQAFPPERIQVPSKDAGAPDLQSDPRGQEERKDPGG